MRKSLKRQSHENRSSTGSSKLMGWGNSTNKLNQIRFGEPICAISQQLADSCGDTLMTYMWECIATLGPGAGSLICSAAGACSDHGFILRPPPVAERYFLSTLAFCFGLSLVLQTESAAYVQHDRPEQLSGLAPFLCKGSAPSACCQLRRWVHQAFRSCSSFLVGGFRNLSFQNGLWP